MKLRYLLLITIHLFLFCTPSVSGQNKPCNNFNCAYLKADSLLRKKEYQKALDNLDSAEGYLTDTNTKEKEQIKQLRRRLFVAIEKEKEEAKRARDEAKRQTEIAKNEKERADKAFFQAERDKKKVQNVLDHIYFYDDKFGLAYDKVTNQYGFIDKDLNIKIGFQFQEALSFDNTGFAKVKKTDKYYLVDTTGKIFKLATEINQLDSTITALDLRNKKIQEIPPSVFFNSQINILLLSSNNLETISSDIKNLNNLNYLNLEANKLTVLPSNIGDLKALKYLKLNSNKLSTLSNEVGELSNLEYLDLSSNQLTALPLEIGKLSNLLHLDLKLNQIKTLPLEITKLSKLTLLDLNANGLITLPYNIGNLSNLTYLLRTNRKYINP